MRKIFLLVLTVLCSTLIFAQSDSIVKKEILGSRALPRSNDHFIIQLGYLSWSGKPDSIRTSGFPRTANVHFMLDFPFHSDKHLSAAIGLGIGSDNMTFKRTNIGIRDNVPAIKFTYVGDKATGTTLQDTTYFKRYKLATTYLEVPVELRWVANRSDDRRSVKIAIGAKAGLLLNAHTKGKTLAYKNGNVINEFKQKEFSKKFFNTNRLVATARIGYGHYSLFGTYQVTTLFKEGLGPQIHPVTIGIALSGL
jgi:hypothetical protein